MVVMVIISVLVLVGVEKYKEQVGRTNSRHVTTTRLPGSEYNDYDDGKLDLIVTDGSSLKVLTVIQKLRAAVTVTQGTDDTVIVRW